MKATTINDIISFNDKEVLLKTILYIKLIQKDFKLSDNDLNILTLFSNNPDKVSVIEEAVRRGFVKTVRSGENFVTRLVNLGILLKTGKKKRKIHKDYLDNTDADIIACKLTLYNECK